MTYEDLQKLFANPIDYSKEFSREVQAISNEISRASGTETHYSEDMNYSAAQRISLYFDDKGQACTRESNSCKFELRFYFSSRGKVFCYLYLMTINGRSWQILQDETGVPKSVESTRKSLENLILQLGYAKVDNTFLNLHVPDRFNEMDGEPATVFSILFSELV